MNGVDGRDRLRVLYAEHWRALFGYACRRCDSVDDAADVVSEVFLVAWRRIDEVPAGAAARLWLFGVGRLTIQNEIRGRDRRHRLGAALIAAFAETDVQDPARFFDRSEDALRVRTALMQLSPVDHELLCLVAWENLSPSQAASVLGINAAAARTRLARARRRLRTLLAEDSSPQLTLSAEGGKNR